MHDIIKDLTKGRHPLYLIFNGGQVRRYHSQGALRAQTVQEHTWRVLAVLLHLWPDASRELIVNAMYHDVEEGVVGDASAPIKRHPVLREHISYLEADTRKAMKLDLPGITDQEHYKLKVADYLELCVTCKNQMRQGKRQASEVFERGLGYVRDYARLLGAVDQLAVSDFINAMSTGAFDE